MYVVLAGWSLLMILPWLWPVLTSVKRPDEVFGSWWPSGLSFESYRRVFTLGSFPRYLANSVITTGLLVGFNIVIDTAAAYAFAKLEFPLKKTLFAALLLTLMIPPQVNLIPLYRMMVRLHEIAPFLGADTLSGIVLPGIVNVTGIFLMRQFFASIPDSLLEAARLDGVGEWGILLRIVFPIAKPALATLTIFILLASWSAFLWPSLISASDASRTLPVGLALMAQKNTVNWPDAMAGSVITALPLAVAFAILQRRFIEGLTAGSVKDL